MKLMRAVRRVIRRNKNKAERLNALVRLHGAIATHPHLRRPKVLQKVRKVIIRLARRMNAEPPPLAV